MAKEIKKITLQTGQVRRITRNPKTMRLIGILAAAFLVLGLIIAAVTIPPVQAVRKQAGILAVSARSAAAAAKNQDLEGMKNGLIQTRKDLTELKSQYSKLGFLKFVPLIRRYVGDGDHAIAAGFAGLDAGDKAIEALEPNADLLGLKGGGKFVQGSADERIQTAVKTMKALTPKINEMSQSVDTMRKEIDAIDPNRYPEKLGKTVIRSRMTEAKNIFDSAANLFVNAQPLLTNLPAILGEPDTKRYLILFQNDKELRPTGGFLTAYALFRVERGKLILEKSDDIYALDNALRKQFTTPPEILKFHKDVFVFHIRDSNLSPDFKISMQKFEEMYRETGGAEDIDGIIALDTHVLVETLRILGPITISGRTFSADIDKRCDCPRAVYELEDYSTRPVGYVREARKDIIGYLMQQIMQQALGVSPSQYWGQLFQMLISEINKKHVLAYFNDVQLQSAVEKFNMAGRIVTAADRAPLFKFDASPSWDYLHVNNSNMAGAKSNMFVSEKITKDTSINSDGTATTKLTVDYKNPYPGSDCGLESGGLCLNARLRNWIRVYTPKGSTLVESKGMVSPKDLKPVPMDKYDSLEKTVFEGFLFIDPMGTARIELTYKTPLEKNSDSYKLLIQKQPGTEGQEYTIKLNGKERKRFILDSDTELTL